jgi:hypothetical protein
VKPARRALRPTKMRSALGTLISRSSGSSGEVARELLDLHLEAADVFQRTFSEDGKLLRLAGQEFAAERGERLVHAFKLLDGLRQDGFSFHIVKCNGAEIVC